MTGRTRKPILSAQIDDACSLASETQPARKTLVFFLASLPPALSDVGNDISLRILHGSVRFLHQVFTNRGFGSLTQLAGLCVRLLHAFKTRQIPYNDISRRILVSLLSKLAEDPASPRQLADPEVEKLLDQAAASIRLPSEGELAPVPATGFGSFVESLAAGLRNRRLVLDFDSILSDYRSGETVDVARARGRLDDYYWDTFLTVINTRLASTTSEHYELSVEERLLINYGLLDETFSGPSNSVSDLILHGLNLHTVELSGSKLLTLSDFLFKKNSGFLKLSRKDSIQQIIDATQTELATLRQRLAALRKHRDGLQTAALHNEELTNIDREMQQIYWYMLEIQHESSRGNITENDRRKVAQYKSRISVLREAKDYLLADLTKIGATQAIVDLDNEIYELMGVFMKLGYDLYELLDIMQEDDQTRKNYLANTRLNDMIEEIKRLRSVSDLIGRHAGTPQSPALISTRTIVTGGELSDTWEQILAADPRLFDFPLVARKGHPDLVLFPGTGNGLYDWYAHSFFIPVLPRKTILLSLLNAAAEWRLDADEDKFMQRGYLKSAGLDETTGIRIYRDNFTADYVRWMTIESKGFQAMNKNLREWFRALTLGR